MRKSPSTGETPGKIVLPDPQLIRCSTSACPPVVPDSTDPHAVYPWQVALDFNNGSVIGLTAFYDQPTSIDDVQAVVNGRYGQWAGAIPDRARPDLAYRAGEIHHKFVEN